MVKILLKIGKQSIMALVKSNGKCGLGPVIPTNPSVGMINFLWDIVTKSYLMTTEIWEDEKLRSMKGHFVLEKNATISQEN